jgi:hypothetical protein
MEIYHEQQESSMPKQNLLVYPNRGRLVMLALLIILLIVILCSGLVIFWSIFLRPVFGPFNDWIVEITGLFFLLFTFTVIQLFWQFWRLLRVLFMRPAQPILVINSAGIQMRVMPGSGNFFISWSEIDAISVHHYRGLRYLGIRPKYPEQYLSRFSTMKQFGMRLYELTGSRLNGLPPINVGIIYLSIPVQEFFHKLSRHYELELSENHVRLLP